MKKKFMLIIAGIMLISLGGCSSGGEAVTPAAPANAGNPDTRTEYEPFLYADNYATCAPEDIYDEGQTTCYVDSVNGSDQNDGLSEVFPVRSQSAIPASCTVVRFKRGSVFNEKLAIPTPFNNIRFGYNVTVYTNYGSESDPLPHFKISSLPGRGPVVLSFKELTIDGLHFSGARGDNTMEHDFDADRDGITKGIVGGIGAFLGGATKFINNEIDDCDIGIMLGAPGSVVRGNYVHDLIMGIDDDPGVDPNLVGGAEGIFINASNCEVSYNAFINCTGPAQWVGSNGTCDGGATEISAASGGIISDVRVHHNFSYNSCGFLEIASYFGDLGKGLVKDSSFHNNMIIDSAWMGLLQVNNTDLDNIHFYNNTLIQHPGSLNAGILWIIFNATSSGMEGGELVPGTVHLTNNLYVLDGISRPRNFLIDSAFDESNEMFVSYSGPADPNYVNLGFANIAGKTPADFDLINASSPAVDAGIDVAGNMLDFFNRGRPFGSAPDIGAMEFGAAALECLPRFPVASEGQSSGLTQRILFMALPGSSGQGPMDLLGTHGSNRYRTDDSDQRGRFSAPGLPGSWGEQTDLDGDGIENDMDRCRNSIVGKTVNIDDCDSGVQNLLSPTGCTLSDDIQTLANGSRNRSQFVARVTPYLDSLVNAARISRSQESAILKCAWTPKIEK